MGRTRGPYRTPYYTVYDNRTDEVLAFGRSEECARQLGVTLGSFYSILSRSRKRGGVGGKYAVTQEPWRRPGKG